MGSTPGGLVFPDPAVDPVRQGAAAIQALAESVEAKLAIGAFIIQAAQAIVTTNEFGQFWITPPQPITSTAPVIIVQDGDGGTGAGYLMWPLASGPAATFTVFARRVSALQDWASNTTLRVNWICIG